MFVCSFKLILPKTNQIYSHLNNCRTRVSRRKLLSKYHINLCSTHFILQLSITQNQSYWNYFAVSNFAAQAFSVECYSFECVQMPKFRTRASVCHWWNNSSAGLWFVGLRVKIFGACKKCDGENAKCILYAFFNKLGIYL